jgi:hypothetical protein
MNAMKTSKVLLAMVLAGGLMTLAQISGGQPGASSVGTAEATAGTAPDDTDNPGACEVRSFDEPDAAQNGAGRKCARQSLFEQGKAIFRFDTFGDEDFWGGKLQLHKAIEGTALGGVGPGVSPKTALTVAGLKVDVEALPRDLQTSLKRGKVDLDSPATTLALLKRIAQRCRHHLRHLPFDRRRLVRPGNRQAAGRLAEPGSQYGSDRLARAQSGADG